MEIKKYLSLIVKNTIYQNINHNKREEIKIQYNLISILELRKSQIMQIDDTKIK